MWRLEVLPSRLRSTRSGLAADDARGIIVDSAHRPSRRLVNPGRPFTVPRSRYPPPPIGRAVGIPDGRAPCVGDEFAEHLGAATTHWIEPAWKMVLSNKSLLPLLWNRPRGHPNLLPASHDPADIAGATVAKPRFGREGEGVHVSDRGMHFAEPGMIYQARAPLFHSAHGHALLGAWVVGDRAAGLGIREDHSLVTGNAARFVPHCFD